MQAVTIGILGGTIINGVPEIIGHQQSIAPELALEHPFILDSLNIQSPPQRQEDTVFVVFHLASGKRAYMTISAGNISRRAPV